jgi:hypothetical protein
MVQLFSGYNLIIAENTIGIVILKRKIQSNPNHIQYSHNNRKGSDNNSDHTQTFFHQYLSQRIPHSAFHRATKQTKINEIKNHSFRE